MAGHSRRAIIVILANDRTRANADALKIDPEAGEGTFGPSLLDTDDVARYRWCSWAMTEGQYETATELFGAGTYGRRMFDGNILSGEQVLALCNLRINAPAGEGP